MSGQAKHTEGPWIIRWYNGHRFLGIRREGDEIGVGIARVNVGHVDHEANALLIAAAPDLLEALQHVASGKSGYLNKVRAAIAKATGEPT